MVVLVGATENNWIVVFFEVYKYTMEYNIERIKISDLYSHI